MEAENTSSLRQALHPTALRAALRLDRPVFANPWDSSVDIFACYVAVSVIEPFLLWGGGAGVFQLAGREVDPRPRAGVFRALR